MLLPEPRGPLSAGLITSLRSGGHEPVLASASRPIGEWALADEDLQLALYVAYELHYRGFEGVPPEMEWDPSVLAARASLEGVFAAALCESIPQRAAVEPGDIGSLLFELAEADEQPPLSKHLGTRGTRDEFREFAIHRSAYQLKEADPHSWAIPRLVGGAKAALVEIQFDEYGSGRAERMHARMFADSMEALGLDPGYGAYLDDIPGHALATVNLMSMFGLHRRWRGAIVGHLAMFEITSAEPNRRYANGLRRLGLEDATPFFDEHVEADSVHENIAAYDLAGGLASQEPELAGDIIFGAECLLALEGRWAAMVLAAWQRGGDSLRERTPHLAA